MKSKIAYVTDIHLEEFTKEHEVDPRRNWMKILQDISSKGIEEIILGGDLGDKKSNKWFFESLKDYKVAITLGNHDSFNEVTKHFNLKLPSGRKEHYYSELRNNHKFIFLDSSSGSVSQEQFDWFRKELNTSKSILLFIHHPILAVDAEVDKRVPLIGRDNMKAELLHIENEVTIFCGHYHLEDERKNNNIRQFITPAVSFQVEKIPNEIRINNSTFGYRIIEIDDSEISTSLVTLYNTK